MLLFSNEYVRSSSQPSETFARVSDSIGQAAIGIAANRRLDLPLAGKIMIHSS